MLPTSPLLSSLLSVLPEDRCGQDKLVLLLVLDKLFLPDKLVDDNLELSKMDFRSGRFFGFGSGEFISGDCKG